MTIPVMLNFTDGTFSARGRKGFDGGSEFRFACKRFWNAALTNIQTYNCERQRGSRSRPHGYLNGMVSQMPGCELTV